MISMIPAQFRSALSIFLVVCALVAVFVAYNWAYNRGYAVAEAIAIEKAEEQRKANESAIAKSEADLRKNLIAMKGEKEKLEYDIERLDREASQDPSGMSCGLRRSGVQRLNAIQ